MKIGIDIDGILTDEHRFIIDYGTKFLCEKNINYPLHNDKYYYRDIFEVSEEEEIEFLKENIFDYANNASIRPFAYEIINKLHNENNDIYFITSRDFTTYENDNKDKMQSAVKKWINKNKIPYEDIIFAADKVSVCKSLGIDIMIEDSPINIPLISEHIPVICFNHPYNEKINNKNVIRCYSWYDIYRTIHSEKILGGK